MAVVCQHFFSGFGADHFPSIVPFKKVLENRPFFAPAPRYGFGAVIFAAITHNPTVMRGSFKADFISGALGGITKTILGTTWHNLDISRQDFGGVKRHSFCTQAVGFAVQSNADAPPRQEHVPIPRWIDQGQKGRNGRKGDNSEMFQQELVTFQ